MNTRGQMHCGSCMRCSEESAHKGCLKGKYGVYEGVKKYVPLEFLRVLFRVLFRARPSHFDKRRCA